MSSNDYFLERFASDQLRERMSQVAAYRLAKNRTGGQRGTEHQFASLLRWWLKLTALIIRYPMNPAGIRTRLGAIGLPQTVMGASHPMGCTGNVCR